MAKSCSKKIIDMSYFLRFISERFDTLLACLVTSLRKFNSKKDDREDGDMVNPIVHNFHKIYSHKWSCIVNVCFQPTSLKEFQRM